MLIDHEVIRYRVRIFLDGGMSYNEALRRAYMEQVPVIASVQHILHENGQPIGSVAS